MTSARLCRAIIGLGAVLAAAVAQEPAGGPAADDPGRGARPVMTAAPRQVGRQPPSRRALVDARDELEQRFREPLFRAGTAAGAERAAEILLDAGATESDRALKWLLCDEARRLGVAAGNAAVIHRAVTLASATYDFDALAVEHRALAEIPLRGVSPPRAAAVAEAAEGLATRAEVDRRFDLALDSQDLAIKAWQRAGATDACRRAMVRHAEISAASQAR